jgi:hypothetical protein
MFGQRRTAAMLTKGVGRRALALAWLVLACAPAAPAFGQAGDWRSYRNRDYGFSLRYPSEYVVLRERKGEAGAGPRALARVRFQERGRAAGQFADLEPPQFSVEVFEPAGRGSLREWLREAGWLDERDAAEAVELEGALEGLHVRKAAQMAPNEFYFYRTGRHLYRLTLLGEHSPAMLASFKLHAQGGRR